MYIKFLLFISVIFIIRKITIKLLSKEILKKISDENSKNEY